MQIVNCTPHEITFCRADGSVFLTLPKSENPVRVVSKTIRTGETVAEIPVSATEFGEISNLPKEIAGTIYIVSAIVANAAKNRSDLFIVNETVRDENGRIIGAQSIARV